LTAGNDSARRHSVNRDDAWDTGSDGGYSSESEDERRRRERRKADQRKAKREKGKGREGGDVRDERGRELPGAERARLDRTVI
jgi:hypothetical protein